MLDTMTNLIHPTAVIDASAKIADTVKIGPYTIVGPQVEIGPHTELFAHVSIERNTRIGAHNKIYPFASLGSAPQHLGYKDEATFLEIGDHNTIREYVTINRGTPKGRQITKIGNHNYLMSLSHIAHDCTVGDHTIFANYAAVAGFVDVGNHANLGAYAGVHQFVRVGEYSFLGRGAKVYNDILPFMLVTGNPGIPHSLNTVGLKRHGFDDTRLRMIKEAFTLIYVRRATKAEILAGLTELAQKSADVAVILHMFESSERGIAR